MRGQYGHGEAVIAGRCIPISLEWLPPGGNVDDAIPTHPVANRKHWLEVTAVKGIERAAADGDPHG